MRICSMVGVNPKALPDPTSHVTVRRQRQIRSTFVCYAEEVVLPNDADTNCRTLKLVQDHQMQQMVRWNQTDLKATEIGKEDIVQQISEHHAWKEKEKKKIQTNIHLDN